MRDRRRRKQYDDWRRLIAVPERAAHPGDPRWGAWATAGTDIHLRCLHRVLRLRRLRQRVPMRGLQRLRRFRLRCVRVRPGLGRGTVRAPALPPALLRRRPLCHGGLRVLQRVPAARPRRPASRPCPLRNSARRSRSPTTPRTPCTPSFGTR